jgi:hypothetical protein
MRTTTEKPKAEGDCSPATCSLEGKLKVGAKIRLGEKFCEGNGCSAGEIIELVEGTFEHENGLYTEYLTAPAVWCDVQRDFESIYHMFGNDLEDFADCEILEANSQESASTPRGDC